ncbi:hypothetical protein BP5796_08328 [Coleophoma crateriformis]|uniref:Major facilitator superfamily (MFS) profile domain-containing protein n=1 Tax=Coleophoma crateriformis TaxID=565419 RepID=A0A3D8R7K5_9HELO|nr:hypothetical protein BP5796_08328 [Coleophoma crateriformis]
MPGVQLNSSETHCEYCNHTITLTCTPREAQVGTPRSIPRKSRPPSISEKKIPRSSGQGVYLKPQAAEESIARPNIVYVKRDARNLLSEEAILNSVPFSPWSAGRPRTLYIYEYSSSSETIHEPYYPPRISKAALPTHRLSADSITYGKKASPPDWEGPDDADNPKIWSTWKRVFHTSIPAFYGFVLTVGLSTYSPSIPLVMEAFDTVREIAVLPLSAYCVGFIIGPLLTAPLSEIYGRRIIYWTTLPLLLINLAIATACNNLAILIVFRFLAGLGGSGSLAVGAGSIADLWDGPKRGKAMIFYILAPFLGPALGPLVGAYIVYDFDNNWKYSQWVLFIIAAPVAIAVIFMKETSKQRILYLRNKKRGIKIPSQETSAKFIFNKLCTAIWRPVDMMIFEPLVCFLSIYTGFAFAMMFSFFGSYNYVFTSVYGFTERGVGLAFIGLIVGFLLAIATFGIFDHTFYRRAFVNAAGQPAPEHRLYAAMVGSIMLPIGLFWFAWSPRESIHWIVPVEAGVPFGWGALTIFISSTTYLVDVYGAANGASAVAANGILRYAFGAAFPLFTIQMYEKLGIHWAGTVFAGISVVMMPVPWVFFAYGKSLRLRSRYETSKL